MNQIQVERRAAPELYEGRHVIQATPHTQHGVPMRYPPIRRFASWKPAE